MGMTGVAPNIALNSRPWPRRVPKPASHTIICRLSQSCACSLRATARTIAVAVAVVLGAWPTPASAQAAPDAQTRAQDAPTTQAEDTRRPSAFVTRVPIPQNQAGQGIAQAAERTPGVYLRQTSSYGQSAYLQIRGGSPRQIAVFINGVRVRVPAGLGFDLGSLDGAGMTTLSVYRGPAAALYGAGALHGALELEAQPSPRRALGTSGMLSLTAGSLQTTQLKADLEHKDKQRRQLRASASWRQSQGQFSFIDDQGTPQQRKNNDHRHLQAVLSANERAGDQRWQAAALIDALDAGVAGPSEFQESLGQARQAQLRGLVSAQWTSQNLSQSQAHAIDLIAGAGLQWRTQDYGNPSTLIGQTRLENHSQATGAQAHAELRGYFKQRHISRARVELHRQDYSATTRQRAADTTQDLRADRRSVALGLSQEYAAPKWSIQAALRAEHILNDATDRQATQSYTPLIPALGALWRPLEALTLRANLARTTRQPDFDELYLEAETLRGDPSLKPERALSADVGVDLNLRRFTAQAVLFSAQTQDHILFVPRSAYLIQATNLGATITQGAEVSGRLTLPHSIELRSSYTWTRARQDSAQAPNPLPNQPAHQLYLSAQATLKPPQAWRWTPPINLGIATLWRSAINLDLFGQAQNQGYTQLQAHVSATFKAGLSAELRALNLLDVRTAVDGLQRPLPGRTIWANLTWSFAP